MKKVCSKILISLIVGMLMISSFAMVRPVEASSIVSPLTYDEMNFSFSGQRSISDICTGWLLTVTVNCTSSGSSNEVIELRVLVNNNTKTYTFKADGQDHKFSNIYMGIGGGNKPVTCTLINTTTGYSTISGKIIFNS